LHVPELKGLTTGSAFLVIYILRWGCLNICNKQKSKIENTSSPTWHHQ